MIIVRNNDLHNNENKFDISVCFVCSPLRLYIAAENAFDSITLEQPGRKTSGETIISVNKTHSFQRHFVAESVPCTPNGNTDTAS